MAVRTSMAALIATTRQMIGDVSTPQDFLDQDVQDVLDAHRTEVRYELLRPVPDIQPGQNGSLVAQFVWASYLSEFQFWESDVVIQGLNTSTNQPWFILTPVTFEFITGKWTFAVTLPNIATPPAQYPPVYAVGKAYDIHAAAADLLERRIALRAFTLFDYTGDGVTLRLAQILDRWEKLRAFHIAKSWDQIITLDRTDLAPSVDYGGVPVLSTDAQSGNHLLPGVLGANVVGSGSGD